jgi:hypothetical protein
MVDLGGGIKARRVWEGEATGRRQLSVWRTGGEEEEARGGEKAPGSAAGAAMVGGERPAGGRR